MHRQRIAFQLDDGKRIGIRSYSVTTSAWLRGILQADSTALSARGRLRLLLLQRRKRAESPTSRKGIRVSACAVSHSPCHTKDWRI